MNKRKIYVKLTLDLVLLVLLALMYQKRAISMQLHEWGGIALCGLFLLLKPWSTMVLTRWSTMARVWAKVPVKAWVWETADPAKAWGAVRAVSVKVGDADRVIRGLT